jgi:hypothetical protein
MHLLRYHATDIGSELPTYISKTELRVVWLIFDVANLKLGIGNKSYSEWLLIGVRDLSHLALSVVVQPYFLLFSTAGGIFRKAPRAKLPYLDVTW